MNNKINNQIISYRARIANLDLPAHLAIWMGQPPVVFTAKVAQARRATEALAADSSRQSAATTGTTADKLREEKELEDAAAAFAAALVTYAVDHGDLTLAHKYDGGLHSWRRLRDENLLQRAQLLLSDAAALLAADGGAAAPAAAEYNITPATLAALQKETADYAAWIIAPRETIAGRSVLTASLPQQSRAISQLFDQLEALLPQFANTPGGPAFAQSFLASSLVINRSHRYDPEPATPPANPGNTPVNPTP